MAIRTPEKIRKTVKSNKGMDGQDLLYIVFVAVGTFLFLKPFIYEPISIFFVLFVVGVTIFLFMPNREVVNAKNYEVVRSILFKDSSVYHACDKSELEEEENEI